MPVSVKRETIHVPETWLWIAGGVAALWLFGPSIIPGFARETARRAGSIVIESAEGVVIGIGEAIGIPPTDAARCQQEVDAGNWFEASKYCPAGTFLKEAGGAIIDTITGETVGYSEPTGESEIISIEPSGYGGVLPDEYPVIEYPYA